MIKEPPRSAILLHSDDNVICLLRGHQTGEIPLIEAIKAPVLREDVPLGHKIALRDIGQGELVFKYGHAIGAATRQIFAGQHVHLHNIRELPQDKPG